MDEMDDIARQICWTGRRLYERGYLAASEGNISCRSAEDRVFCTPSMCCKGNLHPQDLCVVDMTGEQRSGKRAPTSEIRLHLALYTDHPEIRAVVHCHPPHATAFAISSAALPNGLLAEVEYFLQDIPTVDYAPPGTAALARSLARYAATSRCAILRNHGAVSWDRDLVRALWWMEILDSYCRAVILAQPLGELAPLTAAQIEDLRRQGRKRIDDG